MTNGYGFVFGNCPGAVCTCTIFYAVALAHQDNHGQLHLDVNLMVKSIILKLSCYVFNHLI